MTETATVKVDVETGRMEFLVSDADVDEYLAAMGIEDRLFMAPGANLRRVVPPELICKIAMMEVIQDYCIRVIGPNIRAKQGFEFKALVHVGERITAVGKLVEGYEKRGKQFVTFEMKFSNEADELLVVDRRTQLITKPGFRLEH